MNERDAQRNGFYFTGMCTSSYMSNHEKECWEEDKRIAKEIKKLYKGADYVIATGTSNGWLGTGSKAIYGNDIFNNVYDEHRHKYCQNRVDSFEERKQELINEFNAKMLALEESHKKDLDFLDYIKSLRK